MRVDRGRTMAGLALLLAVLAPSGLRAQSLEHDVSSRTVEIRPTFRGAELIFFGSILPELSGGAIDPRAPLDVIVVVRGPPRTYTVRRKERVLGIWLNRSGKVLRDVPGFYFVGSTRPLEEIATPETLSRYSIGALAWDLTEGSEVVPQPAAVAALPPDSAPQTSGDEISSAEAGQDQAQRLTLNTLEEAPPGSDDAGQAHAAAADPFRGALFRALKSSGTLVEAEGQVQFIGRHLFRVGITMPAVVPQGLYGAEVYLVQTGVAVDAQYSVIAVDKKGLERAISELAEEHSIFYGVMAVLLAGFFGWLSAVIFRRV